MSVLIGLIGVLLGLALPACQPGATTAEPIAVGLVAPLSGPSGASGQAIHRGMLLAADEINRTGGVLKRPLSIVARDVQNDPMAGIAALHELVREHRIVAVFGGIYSPVMLAQLDAVHRYRIPLMNPWGSVTAITRNNREPNFAFRVSVSDQYADEFLARYAHEVLDLRRPGVLADSTAWGDSNIDGLKLWLSRLGIRLAGVERFSQGETNLTLQLGRLRSAGADSLLIVANAPEGAAIMRGLATLGWKVPVVSHSGISGGDFVKLAGVENAEGVLALQSFSFADPPGPKARQVLAEYHARYGTRRPEDVVAAVGVAQAYDSLLLLADAIRQAGTTDGDRVREALERPEPYDGVIKRYDPAFTPERHDALMTSDYLMAVWQEGRLVPAPRPRLAP